MLGKLFELMRGVGSVEAAEPGVEEKAHSEGEIAGSLRRRLSAIDGAWLLPQDGKTIDVRLMSISEVVGTLIALRLFLAGERQGLSPFPEEKDLTRVAGLTACALASLAGAKSALEKLEPATALDFEKLKDAALAPAIVRIGLLEDEWRHEFFRLLKMASTELFANEPTHHEKVETFRQLVVTLGIGEMQAFDIGSAADQRQEQVADGISKSLFSMLR